jgi:hypothetical protein
MEMYTAAGKSVLPDGLPGYLARPDLIKMI